MVRIAILASLCAACSLLLLRAQEGQLPDMANPDMPPGYVPPEELVTLQLPRPTIDEVLNLYELLTKKRLIRDSNLAGQNVPIVVPGQIPKREAIALIESALLLNGYTLVPVDEKTSKILGTSKPARSEGIPLYANPAELPAEDIVVSYFMALEYISSEEAKKIFDQYVTVRPFGSIASAPNVNALIITESTPFIRRMIQLQGLIDVKGAKLVTDFIQLKRADAEKVASALNKMIEREKSETPPSQPGASQQAPADSAGTATSDATAPQPSAGPVMTAAVASAGKIEIIADPRTNRVFVMAPESRMPFFRNIIEGFDSAVNLEEPLEFPLRFVSAEDVLATLRDVLREGLEKASTSPESNANGAAPDSGVAGGAALNDTGADSGYGASRMGGAGGVVGKPDILRDPRDTAKPLSIVVGRSRIIADRSLNKVIVIGPPDARSKAASVLRLLDRQPKQIYLATVIGQLTLGDGIEFGVDYLLKFRNFNPGGPTTGLAGVANNSTVFPRSADLLPDPSNVASLIRSATDATLPIASGLTLYGTIAETVDIYARALQTTNRFKIISRPVVYTANNKRAVISSGQQIPIPQNTIENVVGDNSTAVNSSIDYKDVVLKLEVIPLINSDDQITLKIAQQNDTVASQVTISNNEVPVIATQELRTQVTLKNRNTVVLGGLITEEKTRNRRGIPLIGSIPVLGYLFSNTRKQVDRRELIIMIQPMVINNNADVAEANIIEKSMSSMSGELYEEPFPVRRAEIPTEEDYRKLRKTFREMPPY